LDWKPKIAAGTYGITGALWSVISIIMLNELDAKLMGIAELGDVDIENVVGLRTA